MTTPTTPEGPKVRDAMLNRSEKEWEALEGAIVTTYSWRAGHVLTEDDIAALQLVDKCQREDEEAATDCYHRGREEALRERGGDDLVAIHKRISDLEVKAATANTMKLLAESRAKSATARAEAAEGRGTQLLDAIAEASTALCGTWPTTRQDTAWAVGKVEKITRACLAERARAEASERREAWLREALRLAEPLVETLHSTSAHPEVRGSIWGKLKTIRAALTTKSGEASDA